MDHFDNVWLTKLTSTRLRKLTLFQVLVLCLGRPVIISEIGNWSVFVLLGWRFGFGIIIKKRRAGAASSDAITTLGIIKLLLYYVF